MSRTTGRAAALTPALSQKGEGAVRLRAISRKTEPNTAGMPALQTRDTNLDIA